MKPLRQSQVSVIFEFVVFPLSPRGAYSFLTHLHRESLWQDPGFQRGLQILARLQARIEATDEARELFDYHRLQMSLREYSLVAEELLSDMPPEVRAIDSLLLRFTDLLGQDDRDFLLSLDQEGLAFETLEMLLENTAVLDPVEVDTGGMFLG